MHGEPVLTMQFMRIFQGRFAVAIVALAWLCAGSFAAFAENVLVQGNKRVDSETIAAAVWSEKMSQWRITLGPAVLVAARHTAMLVTGADKTEALRHVLQAGVFHADYTPREFPAQIMHNAREVTWYLDRAAADGLD